MMHPATTVRTTEHYCSITEFVYPTGTLVDNRIIIPAGNTNIQIYNTSLQASTCNSNRHRTTIAQLTSADADVILCCSPCINLRKLDRFISSVKFKIHCYIFAFWLIYRGHIIIIKGPSSYTMEEFINSWLK